MLFFWPYFLKITKMLFSWPYFDSFHVRKYRLDMNSLGHNTMFSKFLDVFHCLRILTIAMSEASWIHFSFVNNPFFSFSPYLDTWQFKLLLLSLGIQRFVNMSFIGFLYYFILNLVNSLKSSYAGQPVKFSSIISLFTAYISCFCSHL